MKNVFGITNEQFRIFHTVIYLEPHNIVFVVMACYVLHNFLVKSVAKTHAPIECFDHDNMDESGVENVSLIDQPNSKQFGFYIHSTIINWSELTKASVRMEIFRNTFRLGFFYVCLKTRH